VSSGPIAAATVRVLPDLTGFQALLQAEVNRAVNAITVPTIRANVAATAAAAGVASGNVAAAGSAAAAQARRNTQSLVDESNALRGSLIGISRVTPVTVFGLGLIGTAAAGAALAARKAVIATADFETQLNTFQAVTGVTADELDRVRERAVALGADTSLAAISAGDAALALTELSKAGVSVKDSLAAVRGVLELSGAAAISAGDAARIVATQLNAFKLAGEEATRVADLLAAASFDAQGEIVDFAYAFQQAASVANQSGITIEQTTALLTQLARAGLQGSDAGTSLRTTLLRLTPTTKEAAQFAKALGVQLDENLTLGQQLPQVIEQYRTALLQLNPVQRTTVLNQIFGQDAIRAASIIFSQNRNALDELVRSQDRTGEAARLNEARAKGLGGAFRGLSSNLDTLAINFGELTDGPLEDFVRGLSDMVDGLNKAVAGVDDLASVVGGINIPVIDIPIRVVFDNKVGDFLTSDTLGIGKSLKKAAFLAPAFLAELAGEAEIPPVDLNPGQLDDAFGLGGFLNNAADIQQAGFDKTFGEVAERYKRTHKEARARVAALMAEIAQEAADKFEVKIPTALNTSQLQAQLDGNLQAELKADQAIETFLRKLLARYEKQPLIYEKVLAALVSANQATQAVSNQIAAEQRQAEDDRQLALETAISNQRSRLELEATQAGNTGVAERRLIDFYRRQSQNLKLAESERIAYERLLYEEQRNQTEAIRKAADAELARRDALFELQLRQAQERGNTELAEHLIDQQIQRIKKLQAKEKVRSQAWIDYANQILDLKDKLKDILQQGEGGFTLDDLFNEAVKNFETFGSNIAGRNGVLSRQDARASFSGMAIQRISSAQLTEAEKQTAWLAGGTRGGR